MSNPYIHLGRPIRSFQHFYGHRRELTRVTDDVRNGQCVSVAGIRRIGKTSLLFQLLDADALAAYHLGDEFLCVYIECVRLARMSSGQVYAEIMRRVCRQQRVLYSARGRFDRHGTPADPTALQKPGETLRFQDLEDSILELRDAGIRLVLLLDEFEQLASNPHLDVDFFLGLRALHIEHELIYITASLQPIMELTFSQPEILSSPFPNIFDSVRLGLFSEAESRHLIRAAGVFSPDTEDFLLDLTGGHPLALQYACHFAFEQQQEKTKALASDRHSEAPASDHQIRRSSGLAGRLVTWKTVEAMEGQYRHYWRHLSVDQKRVLLAPTYFAEQMAAQRVPADTPVANLFKNLATLCLLVEHPDGSFDYAGRALAEFVRHEVSRDQSLQVLAASDLVGRMLGNYQITAHLGRGGMSDVYKAHQPSLNRDVAIKVMLPHIATDEGFSARFQREARAVAALRHLHIVQVYDFGYESGTYYMVMEYIDGGNLKDLLEMYAMRGRRMPLEDILRITAQVGDALYYAHGHNLVHRDVKPGNVMLNTAGEAILTDFGLAKIVAGTRFTGSNMVGTPAYMAPEQINESSVVDRRADIYALGVVLYEMAIGQAPFPGDTPAAVLYKHLHAPIPDPRVLRPDLPDTVAWAIQKALAKEPAQRYQTVHEMLDDL